MHELKRESPFAALRPAGSGNGVVAIERSDLSIATVMARRNKSAELGAAVERHFGIVLPAGAKWTANKGVMFLGTGPGKWLAISEAQNPDFVANLEAQLQGVASVADQSGRTRRVAADGSGVAADAGERPSDRSRTGCVSGDVRGCHQHRAHWDNGMEGGRTRRRSTSRLRAVLPAVSGTGWKSPRPSMACPCSARRRERPFAVRDPLNRLASIGCLGSRFCAKGGEIAPPPGYQPEARSYCSVNSSFLSFIMP